MSSAKVEVVAKNCFTTIGEGPHWDPASQSLYTVDIVSGGVHLWNSKTDQEKKINLDGNVSFVIPREKGGLVVGLNGTISSLDFETKETHVLARTIDEDPTNRFNDGKCDKAGRLWAGTIVDFEKNPGPLAGAVGNLYCLDTNLAMSKQDSGIVISNGMDWTEDDSVMYYIDSIPKKVYAYDFDHAAGKISKRRTVVDVAVSGVDGFPDGMCIDCEGKIWVAMYSGSKVVRFDPETGKALTTIDFPTTNITSCCFGGPQLDELYVTSSNWKLPPEQQMGGSLFKITGLGVKGRAPNNFRG